jgi:diguanylate cyclase (GGDEF)-like protein
MKLKLAEVFDEYPNPFYIVKPLGEEEEATDDFEYVYANQAFSRFVGRSQEELMGHRYQECFEQEGEQNWLNLFFDVAKNKKHTYVEDISKVIHKRMYTEAFHIEPNLCACIIHDSRDVEQPVVSQVNAELQYKASRDYLTGFYNRFSLRELYGKIKTEQNIGITYLDINDLKVTNDTFGHEAGDELILLIADMIRSYYEDSMVFRVGGDEFVIITIGQEEQAFLELSVRSREVFEEKDLASIGYQFYPKVDNLKRCIAQCDALMYERKKQLKK